MEMEVTVITELSSVAPPNSQEYRETIISIKRRNEMITEKLLAHQNSKAQLKPSKSARAQRSVDQIRLINKEGPTGYNYNVISEGTEMYSSPQLPLARTRVFSSSSSSSDIERPNPEVGGLEASLLQLVQDHHHISLKLRDQTEKAKKDAIKNAIRVSDLLVDAVNGGVQECFVNEKRIELEIRGLASTIVRFTKQTDQWLTASHSINNAVKEIGDFENWMKTMDFDCKSVNAAIRNIHQS